MPSLRSIIQFSSVRSSQWMERSGWRVGPVMDPPHFVAFSFMDPIVASKVRPQFLYKNSTFEPLLILDYSWTNQRILHTIVLC